MASTAITVSLCQVMESRAGLSVQRTGNPRQADLKRTAAGVRLEHRGIGEKLTYSRCRNPESRVRMRGIMTQINALTRPR